MRTYLDCIPCFVRQSLEAIRFVSEDVNLHEKVLREVLRYASEMDLHDSPPIMGRRIHRLIKEITGIDDPYEKVKEYFNHFAMKRYPELKKRIRQSPNPLETAVRLSIAGNIIDFGPNKEIDDFYVQHAIEHSLTAHFMDRDMKDFQQSLNDAETILFIGDNAGEIVFDKLLIELLPMQKIVYAVRGYPIINDATMADAQAVGITDLVHVIDNGNDAPGTILELCSETFLDHFYNASFIIAKGQGNYETLSHSPQNIFFILKAKCPVIANHIGCEVGDLVLNYNRNVPQEEKQDSRLDPYSLEDRSRVLSNF